MKLKYFFLSFFISIILIPLSHTQNDNKEKQTTQKDKTEQLTFWQKIKKGLTNIKDWFYQKWQAMTKKKKEKVKICPKAVSFQVGKPKPGSQTNE